MKSKPAFTIALFAGLLCTGSSWADGPEPGIDPSELSTISPFAGNSLINPDFDIGVAGWSAPTGSLTFSASGDVDGCAGSGVAHLAAPVFVNNLWQSEFAGTGSCLPVFPENRYRLVLGLLPGSAFDTTTVGILAYTDSTCTAGETSTLLAGFSHLAVAWHNFRLGGLVGSGVHSIRYWLRFRDADDPSFAVDIDRIYLGIEEPVFVDPLEAGSLCRWSSTVP
ncbi:MAG: hypothetical protein ABI639_04735 [Thermoanaerobaculia bacterium]